MVVFADFISVFPLDFILFLAKVDVTIITVIRLNKMLLTYRMAEYSAVINVAMDSNRFLKRVGYGTRRVVLFLCTIILFLHILACFWYYVGTINEVSWFQLKGGHVLRQKLTGKYLDSVSWALATVSSVGYGDFYATNTLEIIYIVITIICGAVMNAGIIGSISIHASIMIKRQSTYEQKVAAIRRSVCCLLSAVCCLLSAVCYLLSAVCCLLSPVCCLLSAVCCCLLSAVYGLLCAVCGLLSPICRLPSD
jgi:hypothetical protein